MTSFVCVEQYAFRSLGRCSGKLHRKILNLRGLGWAGRCGGKNAESSEPERTAADFSQLVLCGSEYMGKKLKWMWIVVLSTVILD